MSSSDLYQRITDTIVEQINTGTLPWVKPWSGNGSSMGLNMLPKNHATGRHYNGVNVLILWMAATANGYAHPRWLTFNQCKALGGSVKKGSKATEIVYFTKIPNKGKPGMTKEEIAKLPPIPILKSFYVFNVAQCEGLELPTVEPVREPKEPMTQIRAIEDAIVATKASIHYGVNNDRAYYNPAVDYINMPLFACFHNVPSYYGTIFHELTHWTGHKDRLAREGITNPIKFGSEDYAFEELIAELGAAFCCASVGLDTITRTDEVNHAGYIKSWLRKLESDNRYIFRAASAATKAMDWLLPVTTEDDGEGE